jgi:hypothetical protein
MAQAKIENRAIVIRLPIKSLPTVVEGAWATNVMDVRYMVIDPEMFAQDLVRELNDEDENGATRIHKMFDRAIEVAIEQGAEGVEIHEDQGSQYFTSLPA